MEIKKYKAFSNKLIITGRKVNELNKSVSESAVKANNIKAGQMLRQSITEKRIAKRDWKSLERNSKKNYSEYSMLINEFISVVSKRNKQVKARDTELSKLKPFLKPVKKAKDWKKHKENIKAQLKRKRVSKKKTDAFIKHLETITFNNIVKEIKILDTQMNTLSAGTFDKLLNAYIYQFYAYCCSRSNILLKSSKSYASLKNKIKGQEKSINGSFSTIKKMLKANDENLVQYCRQLGSSITSNLISNLLPLASALYKRKTLNKKIFDDTVKNSILTGELIRKSILLLAVTKRLHFLSVNNYSQDDLSSWKKSASLKGLEDPGSINAVKFGSLASAGARYSNKMITLKGRIIKISIRHIRKKPISTAFITDGKYIVMANIPHIKIDSGGLAPGSYAAISGRWKQRNKEVFNKPSLAVDRIDLGKSSKKFWMPWVSLQMNDIFEMMPHSVNARVSWKPGRSGAINRIKYSLI